MQPVGYCWVHGTSRSASAKGLYHKMEGEDRWCMESGIVDAEVEVSGLVEEAKKLGAEAFLEGMANEPPPPPPAPAPEPETHYCERHKVEYSQEKDGAKRYYHQWNDNKHWCMEGDDSLRDAQGKPVTEATML